MAADGEQEDPADPTGKWALEAQQLRKVYDNGKVAVQKLSFAVQRGECFGLLGENGAGKTTSISMLTGVFPPTSGGGRVCGLSIEDDIEEVHRKIGVCPQHDIYWPQLSVYTHLLYYSRLKGVPPEHVSSHIQSALVEVGLQDCPHRKAGALSGGMRRRLSLAIALIGDAQLIFLDEPTTGLDPTSRRHMWTILERARAKAGRTLVLTTHAMDEAELLCSRIGIMTHGRMRCIGDSQRLKNRYGGGYRLQITFNADNHGRATAAVARLFPKAEVLEEYRTQCMYRILATAAHGNAAAGGGAGAGGPPPSPNTRIARGATGVAAAFERMAAEAKGAGITDWCIAQVGLEDVFHTIIEKYSTPG